MHQSTKPEAKGRRHHDKNYLEIVVDLVEAMQEATDGGHAIIPRGVERRVDAAVRRGSLTSADELLECRTAPNGERVHFSIRGMLEDGDGSQDPGWMDPA